MFFKCVVIAFAAFSIHFASTQLAKDKNRLLNWCLNATLHKATPGKEDSLHDQCLPWSEKSCCTAETTKKIHEGDMHNFNLNHCYEETGKNLSLECRKYFYNDNCFYECEPHIGLWVVKTNRRIATERFQNVPLCESECSSWWKACKDDFTCAHNWPRNFQFKDGKNFCREGSKCQSFQSVYRSAKEFCENVWDNSWKVTPDDKPCMRIWFSDPLNNPNAEAADYYVAQWLKGGVEYTVRSSMVLLLCAIIFVFINF